MGTGDAISETGSRAAAVEIRGPGRSVTVDRDGGVWARGALQHYYDVDPRCGTLGDFIAEVRISAGLEAEARGCELTAGTVDAGLAVLADRELLASAVGNLLQNAFKFTERHTEVSLSAHAAGDRVLIEVEDHCGGLPPGAAEQMFQPFVQNDADRSGLGLGLSICRNSVEANEGALRVRDLPGSGCVFVIDLPRHAVP